MGLPLAIAVASTGLNVVALDIDAEAVDLVNSGTMPFMEEGAAPLLKDVLDSGRFRAVIDPRCLADASIVVVVIGTPVDGHLDPDPNEVVRAIEECTPFLTDEHLVILRSTVYPGVTRKVERMLAQRGLQTGVAFCPERIVEGKALEELRSLPQIVGATDPLVASRAEALFQRFGAPTVVVTPEEAELAKLFTNAWRYIKFAAANQFWLMANQAGLDFSRVLNAIRFEYPRAADLPGPGLAAGPCLFKDTAQLAAFSNNNFPLGNAAMMVNEGQPLYIADRLSARFDLANMTVGILGMAFKAESDDVRSSLSYKLKRILEFRSKEVLTTDPYATSDQHLLPISEVLERSDLIIIGAPHAIYQTMAFNQPVIDVWNLRGNGSSV